MLVVDRRVQVALVREEVDGVSYIRLADALALQFIHHKVDGDADPVVVVRINGREELEHLRRAPKGLKG